jgi:hypothetical protein
MAQHLFNRAVNWIPNCYSRNIPLTLLIERRRWGVYILVGMATPNHICPISQTRIALQRKGVYMSRSPHKIIIYFSVFIDW